MEEGGSRDQSGEVERHRGDNTNSRLIDTVPLDVCALKKKWICLRDVLHPLRALVLFRVRGLDVKVRFSLRAFGANGNEQIACLMAPTLRITRVFST